MNLVIAEKPSVAQSIARVLGATNKKDGFTEGNGYIVSWCLGHLAGLAQADRYDEKYSKWRYEDLPIIPPQWKMSIGSDKEKQFYTLKKLLNDERVEFVVNACDAGREGELIFRNVYTLSQCKKPVRRLWISSMEDESIKKGFENLKDGKEYDNLYQSALCRAKADWLVGINATRLFSILYNSKLNIGRVMSPTLALIVQRESEISSFKSEPFYTVEIKCGGLTASSEKFKERLSAENIINSCNGMKAVVHRIESVEKKEKAPQLFDLTSLQRTANRILGYTAQQTLDYTQSLYEKKLCTYPRTDSRFLTDDMEENVPVLTEIASEICNLPYPSETDSKKVCDSRKVSDHHAIVPTLTAKGFNTEELSSGECEILKLLARQLLCAVSSEHRYSETEIVLKCGDNLFTAKKKEITHIGWKAYVKEEQKSEKAPDFQQDECLDVEEMTIKEGMTSPPKHFTEVILCISKEWTIPKERSSA